MKLNKQMRFFFALLHVSVSEVLSVIMNDFRHNCVCVCEYHWPGSDMGDHLVLWLDDEVEHEQHGGHWRHCWVHVGSTVFGQMCVFFFFLVCKTIDCLICASNISLYCSYGDISCHVWHYIAVLLNVSEYSAIPHSFYILKYYKYNQTCEVVRLKCLSLQLLKTFLHMQCNIKWALRI